MPPRSTRPIGTLVRPPDNDTSRAQIENVLELTPLADIGPDIFTNTRPLWHPPGARGIYGGAAIAMCLSAAQQTVAASFWVHSMHCYFVLAGDSAIPVLYHVERVREGKSFATRTVQARQRGKCIFTTTISFMREGSAGAETVGHEALLPEEAGKWLEEVELAEQERNAESEQQKRNNKSASESDFESSSPFVSQRMDTAGNPGSDIAAKRTRQWIKCRGKISEAAGPQAHLSALAYMSDSYFIGTVARVHNLWRFGRPSANGSEPKRPRSRSSSPQREGSSESAASSSSSSSSTSSLPSISSPSSSLSSSSASSSTSSTLSSRMTSTPSSPIPLPPAKTPASHPIAALEARENAGSVNAPRAIGMMVSLDHSIYFHNPRAVKADEWSFAQMESPWAGDGRGLVLQKIWSRSGELLATCVQEGLVRLVQGGERVKL